MNEHMDLTLKRLNRLVGSWSLQATHPAFAGVVRGTAVIEWLEGERFLIHRARNDHPEFPDSISIIGFSEQDRVGGSPGTEHAHDAEALARFAQPTLHYFDSRGVFRVYHAAIDDHSWRLWRDAPGFSQRFVGKLAEDGNSIDGMWQLCQDDVHWADDLAIVYRRQP